MPCIGVDRADLALAGGAILEAVCRQWAAPVVRVADRGLREGVLMDLDAPKPIATPTGSAAGATSRGNGTARAGRRVGAPRFA